LVLDDPADVGRYAGGRLLRAEKLVMS